MFIGELKVTKPTAIRHSNGHYRVLCPSGAVFDTFLTDDLTEMSIACALLFDDQWEIAPESDLEVNLLYAKFEKLMRLVWIK